MLSDQLRDSLKEYGLTPEVCTSFMVLDLEKHKKDFDKIKSLLDSESRIKEEIILMERELLLRALRRS
jgi:hypothetical protein